MGFATLTSDSAICSTRDVASVPELASSAVVIDRSRNFCSEIKQHQQSARRSQNVSPPPIFPLAGVHLQDRHLI